ncbi:MAG: DJ-1/PfpI family protein [Polyangiaceae bacterium]
MSRSSSKNWLTRALGLGTLAALALIAVPKIAAVGTAEAKEEVLVPENYTRNVAIVLWEGVELLDFAGPGEVFAAAANEGADRGHAAFHVYTVAPSKKPLKSQGFVTIAPEYGVDDAPAPDIVVIPGGSAQVLVKDPSFMRWASGAMKNAKLTLTVCTGAFVPANLGLFDGLSVTTHHSAFDRLRTAAPKATVIEGKRFIDNGAIITSAGVSAGIDGALHTVARLLGRKVADDTARYMEYHWTPEAYLATAYPYLNPSLDEHGRALQQASVYEEAKDFAQAEKSYRALIEAYPKDGSGWYGLAGVLHAKGEWDRAIEAGERAAKFGSVRSDALFNVALAYARQGKRDDAFANLRLAVDAGFKKKWQLEGASELVDLRGDSRYGEILKAL